MAEVYRSRSVGLDSGGVLRPMHTRDDRYPVSNEISDLCEISDLLLFFSYFASQNKEIKSGNYFCDVCCAN